MPKRALYSDHLDALLALVQHLAMTKYKSRQPTNLAKYLSLEPDEVFLVLESFKGLFRKSQKSDPQTKEYYYTLQLRYARRWLGENKKQGLDGASLNQPTWQMMTIPIYRSHSKQII